MSPTSGSCPQPHRYEPSGEEKRNARLLPAFEAYRGILSRLIGLHHWLAKNYRYALVHLVGVLLILAGLSALAAGFLDPDHVHFCCYPKEAPKGTLGSCADTSAVIHTHPDKKECTTNGPQFWIITALCLVVAGGLYYLAHSNAARESFFRCCARQHNVLQQYLKQIQYPPNATEAERKLTEEVHVKLWLRKEHGLLLLILMPEGFLFGLHFRTFGKTVLYYMYNLFLWLGVATTLVFVTTAHPLDDAWGCYPHPTLRTTNQGRCDTKNSTAHRTYASSKKQHLEFYWICVGLMAGCLSLALGLYLYSIINFRTLYARRVVRKLNYYRRRA